MIRKLLCVARSSVRRRQGKRLAGSLRSFHGTAVRGVRISFQEESSGESIKMDAEEGKSLLDIALEHNIDIEGACGGEMACSTCHVILPQKYFDLLDEKCEEEEDMLDLAWGVTDRSRLGCQVKIKKELEGMEVVVPAETNSML